MHPFIIKEQLELYNPIAVGLQLNVYNLSGLPLKECFEGLYEPLEKGNNSMPFEIDRTKERNSAFKKCSLWLYVFQMALFKTPVGKTFSELFYFAIVSNQIYPHYFLQFTIQCGIHQRIRLHNTKLSCILNYIFE